MGSLAMNSRALSRGMTSGPKSPIWSHLSRRAPQDLDLVALAGRPQPGNGFARIFAEERIAFRRFLDHDAAPLFLVERFDTGQEIIGFLLHGLPLLSSYSSPLLWANHPDWPPGGYNKREGLVRPFPRCVHGRNSVTRGTGQDSKAGAAPRRGKTVHVRCLYHTLDQLEEPVPGTRSGQPLRDLPGPQDAGARRAREGAFQRREGSTSSGNDGNGAD